MSAVAEDRLRVIEDTTSIELEEVRERRRALALTALVGEGDEGVKARAALEATELDERSLEARLALVGAARVQLADEQQRDEETAQADERQRLEDERVSLETEYAEELRVMQRSASEAGKAAAKAVQFGNRLRDLRSELGLHNGRSVAGLVGSLLAVRVQDEEPSLELSRVLAYERSQLLAEYAIPDEADDAKQTGRACTVCDHPQRAELEAELAGGLSLRQAEERFAVSKSAISRHRQHASE